MDALLLEIIGHLGAAKSQMLPTDDRIICERVASALAVATAARRALHERPDLVPEHLRAAA